MKKKCKSFICYRLANPAYPSWEWSENTGRLLEYVINNTSLLKDARPVLFQQSLGSYSGVTWNEDGIKENLPDCSYFYVALCPDFFEPLLNECVQTSKASHANSGDDEAKLIRSAAKTLSGYREKDKNLPVSCIELLYAWAYGVRVCPIQVANKREAHQNLIPSESNLRRLAALFVCMCKERGLHEHCEALRQEKNLYKFFKNQLNHLFTEANAPQFDYGKFPNELKNKDWRRQPSNEINRFTDSDPVAKLSLELVSMLKPNPPDQFIRRWYDNSEYSKCLKACANVMKTACIPYQGEHSDSQGNNEAFAVNNANIIYDPLYTESPYSYPQLTYRLCKQYSANKDLLRLDSDKLLFWPEDLSKSQKISHAPHHSISVCGVCFGTLVCYHRLTKDDAVDLDDDEKKTYERIYKKGIQTLIALRHPEQYDWPGKWEIVDGIAKITGTINQTTLSLSTLLSCNFLEPGSDNKEADKKVLEEADKKVLEEREKFIWQSIDCLLKGRGDTDSPGWSYTCDVRDDDEILPTVFVFQLLLKYHECLLNLEKYNIPISAKPKGIAKEITQTLRFFKHKQESGSGCYHKDGEPSITHTAYVVKALDQYLTHQKENPSASFGKDSPVSVESVQEIYNKAVQYLLRETALRMEETYKEETRQIRIEPHERNEIFSIDNYEHCAELIIGETLIKIIERFFGEEKDEEAIRAFVILRQLAATYISTVECKGSTKIVIRSTREEDIVTPSYYIYYYRMFISDLVKLLKYNEKKGRKKLIDVPAFPLTLSTWNIGSLHEGPHYDRNLNYLQSVLTEHTTDILCLQECPNDPLFLQQLKEWTGLTHTYFFITSESHIDRMHDMGLCILSRLPVTEIRQIKPVKPQIEAWHKGKQEYWHDKLFLAAKCAFHERELLVITGHGFPFHRYGLDDGAHDDVIAPSFAQLDAWIEGLQTEFPHTPFCIAADFNYGEPLRFMPHLRESFRDAFDGEATRPSGRKTDAILLPVEYRPDGKCNVVAPLNENGRGYFDHNFIAATYSL